MGGLELSGPFVIVGVLYFPFSVDLQANDTEVVLAGK